MEFVDPNRIAAGDGTGAGQEGRVLGEKVEKSGEHSEGLWGEWKRLLTRAARSRPAAEQASGWP